jgi:hypothetical protein
MSSEIEPSKVYTKAELCLMEKIPEPCAMVIFGASGDSRGGRGKNAVVPRAIPGRGA